MAYKRGVEEVRYNAQLSCNSIVTVWAMQMGGRNERMTDSSRNDSQVNEYLVKANL